MKTWGSIGLDKLCPIIIFLCYDLCLIIFMLALKILSYHAFNYMYEVVDSLHAVTVMHAWLFACNITEIIIF